MEPVTRRMVPYLQTTIPFIWIGFVGAISFMEAWLKFTPSVVSLTEGLAIGEVVYAALNKVELMAAILLSIGLLLERRWILRVDIFYLFAIAILFIQSVWVLPYLSSRVDIYMTGVTPPQSNGHFYFVLLEVLKVISLLVYGIKKLTIWKMYTH